MEEKIEFLNMKSLFFWVEKLGSFFPFFEFFYIA